MTDGCYCVKCGSPRPEKPGPCAVCGETRRRFEESVHAEAHAEVSMTAAARRGPQSWAYFHLAAGLFLTIMIAVASVLDIPGWAKAISIPSLAILILVVVLDSGRVHEWLLRLKSAYQDKLR